MISYRSAIRRLSLVIVVDLFIAGVAANNYPPDFFPQSVSGDALQRMPSRHEWVIRRGILTLLFVAGVGIAALHAADVTKEETMGLTLTSTAFQHGQPIPMRYTCDGEDLSPPLAWSGAPSGTKSLALINDDPDAPMGTWVHWVAYNLPPSTSRLPEAFPSDPGFPDGTRQGRTDFGRTGYGGPCPPSGTHRYVFKLYALDAVLSLQPGATAKQLEAALRGHVLAEAKLMGTYRRRNR